MHGSSYGFFVKWCRTKPEHAASAFRVIWDATRPLAPRFDDFIAIVRSNGGRAYDAEAAFPNMAIDPYRYPMFRVTQVADAMTLTGYEKPRAPSRSGYGARYEHYLGFLDRIIAEASERGLYLRDRLDAQGVLWAVVKGDPGNDWSEQECRTLLTFRSGNVPTETVNSDDVSRAAFHLDREDAFSPASLNDARVRVSRSIATRQGQPKFRMALLKVYGGRCAITGCAVIELLEAAHIVPYMGEPTNDVRNGLLLRADIHTLFDLGLLTIDPDSWTVKIASVLDDTEYAPLAGVSVRLPSGVAAQPSTEALRLRSLRA
jgi:hypothetical protein